MGKYAFDKEINRYGTDCIKFDFKKEYGKEDDVIPLWVADADFEIPKEASEEIRARALHPIYGYTEGKSGYYDSLCRWMKRRHGYESKEDWVINTPGVIFAMVMALRRFTKPGDAVMFLSPVYPQFLGSIVHNGRKPVAVSLVQEEKREDGYYMDYQRIEEELVKNDVKMFFLCNPHNPVGRVWTKAELIRLGEILLRHGVLVVSDEIHMDFVYPGHKHVVFASLSENIAKKTITCTSPSKTFNIAGLQQANIIISDEKLREAFKEEVESTGYMEPNVFGMIASRACYEYGEDYVEEMLRYLEGNIEYVARFLKENMPKARLIRPQGTYLLWVDFTRYGYEKEELVNRIEHVAKLWLSDGESFGREGRGYMRINIATNLTTIKKACERMLLI